MDVTIKDIYGNPTAVRLSQNFRSNSMRLRCDSSDSELDPSLVTVPASGSQRSLEMTNKSLDRKPSSMQLKLKKMSSSHNVQLSEDFMERQDSIVFQDGSLRKKLHVVAPSCCVACPPCNPLFYPLRKAVSRKKVRWEKDGFSLDLTYLTDNIIVMGFPAVGVEHMFRNPRSELYRFMKTRHNDKFFVYNFCCEAGRAYPPSTFDNRVKRFPFEDHGIPPLTTIVKFCEDAAQWLDSSEGNVVAMHCKAGKGRAGLMACCLLIRMGVCKTAKEVSALFYELHPPPPSSLHDLYLRRLSTTALEG